MIPELKDTYSRTEQSTMAKNVLASSPGLRILYTDKKEKKYTVHVHSKVLDSAQVLRALVELKLNRSHLISPLRCSAASCIHSHPRPADCAVQSL